MAFQLIYTSAPRLLEAGQTGFGVVARHREISAVAVRELERASQFTREHGYRVDRIRFAHWILNAGAKRFHVISRVRDAGADYTGRTNHIAHHIVIEGREVSQIEKSGLDPATIALSIAWRDQWSEDPTWLGSDEEIDLLRLPISDFSHPIAWETVAHNPNRAYTLTNCGREKTLLVKPRGLQDADTSVLQLFAESLVPMDTHRWQITFAIEPEPRDDRTSLSWISLAPDSPLRDNASTGRLVLDLGDPDSIAISSPPAPPQSLAYPTTDSHLLGTQPVPHGPPTSIPVADEQAASPGTWQQSIRGTSTFANASKRGSNANPPTKKSRPFAIIAGVAAVLILGIGGGLLFWQISENRVRQEQENELNSFFDLHQTQLFPGETKSKWVAERARRWPPDKGTDLRNRLQEISAFQTLFNDPKADLYATNKRLQTIGKFLHANPNLADDLGISDDLLEPVRTLPEQTKKKTQVLGDWLRSQDSELPESSDLATRLAIEKTKDQAGGAFNAHLRNDAEVDEATIAQAAKINDYWGLNGDAKIKEARNRLSARDEERRRVEAAAVAAEAEKPKTQPGRLPFFSGSESSIPVIVTSENPGFEYHISNPASYNTLQQYDASGNSPELEKDPGLNFFRDNKTNIAELTESGIEILDRTITGPVLFVFKNVYEILLIPSDFTPSEPIFEDLHDVVAFDDGIKIPPKVGEVLKKLHKNCQHLGGFTITLQPRARGDVGNLKYEDGHFESSLWSNRREKQKQLDELETQLAKTPPPPPDNASSWEEAEEALTEILDDIVRSQGLNLDVNDNEREAVKKRLKEGKFGWGNDIEKLLRNASEVNSERTPLKNSGSRAVFPKPIPDEELKRGENVAFKNLQEPYISKLEDYLHFKDGAWAEKILTINAYRPEVPKPNRNPEVNIKELDANIDEISAKIKRLKSTDEFIVYLEWGSESTSQKVPLVKLINTNAEKP